MVVTIVSDIFGRGSVVYFSSLMVRLKFSFLGAKCAISTLCWCHKFSVFFFFLVESCSVLGIEKVDVFGSFDTYPCSFSLGQSS